MAGLLAAFALSLGMLEPAEAKSPKAKKYYVTKAEFEGNAALTACEKGFHMASFWEIRDTADLKYDTTRGHTTDDSGFGPPNDVDAVGWIRTGGSASITHLGRANCLAWTTNGEFPAGTMIELDSSWSESGQVISPWKASVNTCNVPRQVWCVED